ncbi:hypothetical protein CWC38_08700 [Kocuria tytonicola]|uniref:hypothetical protein n=1 Tax=Kocuria tytonicola TaxID=2055946 RepID=UPI000EF8D774|nr:hypothetical protein [Kocuria tytonicola]RLZ02886.1 hypothetical protein CWC38_08700 [Kocuria tytonicola]
MNEFTNEQITCGLIAHHMMQGISAAPTWNLGALDEHFEKAFSGSEAFAVEDLADATTLVLHFVLEAAENAGVRERVVRELEGRL